MTVVAIDGPGGSGKSTVARALADRLGIERLDTGAMYRSVTLAALRRGIAPADGPALGELARDLELEVGVTGAAGTDRVVLFGEDVTEEIRGEAVSAVVSLVAAHPAVRVELVARQRHWLATRGAGVVEGRDITSVVLPDADVKVFLTADPAVRAERRSHELTGSHASAFDRARLARVGEAISRRDELDATREVSPLVVADGAVVVDSTAKSVDEVVDEILALL